MLNRQSLFTIALVGVFLIALSVTPVYPQGDEICGLRFPHPVDDLVGYLNLDVPILYAAPGHESRVLQSLRARPIEDGWFQFEVITPDGEVQSYAFGLSIVRTPALFQEPGELIGQSGIYKFYKNAQCAVTSPAMSIGCGPYRDGQHATVDWVEKKKCLAGSDYCTEINSVWWTRKVYDDNQCRVLLQIDTGKDFMCP